MKNKLKAIGFCIIAVVILAISQGIAMIIGSLFSILGLPDFIEAFVDSILYPVLSFIGLKLTAEKIFKYSLKDFRIKKPEIKWYWVVVSVLLPLSVIAMFQFISGEWIINEVGLITKISITVWGILFYGVAVGIVEEMVFRGVIMGVLEKEFNLKIAIIVPSVLFGLVHIIGISLDIMSVIQLIIAGTMVGIMFSLIEYQSGNFWNNAITHGLWNALIIGIFHIGLEKSDSSLLSYVFNSDSFIISGGDFGIESSIFAITGYVVVSVIALVLIKKKRV